MGGKVRECGASLWSRLSGSPSRRASWVIILGLVSLWLVVPGRYDDPGSAGTSRYMSFADKDDAKNRARILGCEGAESGGGVVVLAYGKQVEGGTRSFGSEEEHHSYSDLIDLTLAYGDGLKTCSRQNWTVVVATSNYKLSEETPAETWGRDWALMVNLLSKTGETRIKYVGGIDLEPGWGTPDESLEWLRGYRKNAMTPLWANASADGCPVKGPGTCANGWTTAMLGRAVWDEEGVVLPQIYRRDGIQAAQWANLARMYLKEGGSPRFGAVMTQRRACAQVRNPGCEALNNKPRDAVKQLNSFLEGTGMVVRRATDIGWE